MKNDENAKKMGDRYEELGKISKMKKERRVKASDE